MLDEDLSQEGLIENEITIEEQLPGETVDDMPDDIPEEIVIPEDFSDSLQLEEDPTNELIIEDGFQNEIMADSADSAEDPAQDPQEQILYYCQKMSETVEIMQANQKTGIENLQLLSTYSLGIECMMFGGFALFCFLNRLG